ncbi:C1QL [Mytilus coruscus]|uniref:C1QL n=1 Tax=Mytilus coruscus TaxID=42192 RepID=A0A6J8EY67_MYTCO|nr:C1QL [Mytilus coruscus]
MDGFLLETNTQANQAAGNNHYLTISEFYEAKKQEKYDLTVLRHQMEQMKLDSDKTLALLTTQVTEKFTALEKSTLGTKVENDTRELDKLQGKYRELEENNTKLVENLDNLQAKYKQLEDKFSYEIETLKRKVEMLDQLKVVQQLTNISALQLKVDKIDSQTHSLAVNQQARTQDFLALYNQTIANENNLKAHKIYQKNILKNLTNTLYNSTATINAEISQVEQNINMTNSRFDKANERVGFTSCARSDVAYQAGSFIKFSDVLFNIGISNISTFKSTGKFTCKAPGFYQISVTIISNNSVRFGIYMNGHQVSKAYLDSSTATESGTTVAVVVLQMNDEAYISNTTNYESGIGVAAVALEVNDEVWVQSEDGTLNVNSYASCITLMKRYEGFLLEPSTNNASNSQGNKLYVTLNDFYEAKNEQQYDVTVLRHQMERMKADSDKTLTMLTSQIQRKLASIENPFTMNGKMNDTNELQLLQRITRELQDKNTKLQHNFDNLQVKYTAIENELLLSRKTTAKLVVDVHTLQQLKPVQDLTELKQEVQSIRSKTNLLAFNQQARNQDFLALYNDTIINQNYVAFEMIASNYNICMSDVNGRIDQNERNINRTDARVEKATEKVAMTSCVIHDKVLSRGETLKFDNVLTNVGIDNLSSFQSTGKFNCTKEGLYIVSIWVLAQTASRGYHVHIYKNNNILSETYISNRNHYDTGPATVAVELEVEDNVWVQFDNGKVDSYGSCMTIIKIM